MSKIKVDRWIYNELKRIVNLKPENAHAHLSVLLKDLSPIAQRTSQQNRGLHLFFSLLAEQLNLAGLEMKLVLRGETEIWWTGESVKEYLWRPVQEALYGKRSTRELEKQVEIDHTHENLMRLLGEKHGLEYIPFPSYPQFEVEHPLQDNN